jgi:hypothetical protein
VSSVSLWFSWFAINHHRATEDTELHGENH